jgi:hypothetical protein
MLPDGSRWGDIKDLSGEALNGKYAANSRSGG